MPFINSRASWQLTRMTSIGIAFGTLVPYTLLGKTLDLYPMPLIYFPCLIVTILCYMCLATVLKTLFVRKYGDLL